MMPIDKFTNIIWKDICLSNERQCTLRSGKYVCLFDEHTSTQVCSGSFMNSSPIDVKYHSRYPQKRTLKIQNLETNCLEKEFAIGNYENVLAFSYPYVLTEAENHLKLWDLRKESVEPVILSRFTTPHILTFKADIVDNALAACIIDPDPAQPKMVISVIGINDPNKASWKVTSFEDSDIDVKTGFKIWNDSLIYSIGFGTLKIVNMKDPQSVRCVSHVDDLNTYLESLTEENYAEYEKSTITSLVAENNTVIGSTTTSIKIWDIVSGILKEIIPAENMTLISLEGRFLLGTNNKLVTIWDIFSGQILYSEKRDCFVNDIPHLTLYKDTIYRVQAKWGTIENRAPIRVQLPQVPSDKPIQPEQAPKKEPEEICIIS